MKTIERHSDCEKQQDLRGSAGPDGAREDSVKRVRFKRMLITGGKLLVSGGLLFILYRSIPVSDLGNILLSVDWRYLVPVFALLFVNTLVSARKWQLFLRADGIEIALLTLTGTYMIGNVYNMFLPSNIGGDSYRIWDVGRRSGRGVRTAAAVFADRVSGFVAMVSLGVAASPFVALHFGKPLFFLGPLAVFIALVLMLVALFRQSPFRLFMRICRLDQIFLLNQLVEKFFVSISRYGTNRALLLQTLGLSFLFQATVFLIIYCMALSLHAKVSFLYFCAFIPLIGLLEVLPLSINGIGLRDVGYVFFFGWAGMSDLQTRSLALLVLGLSALYSLIGGGLFFLGRSWSSTVGAPAIFGGSKKPDNSVRSESNLKRKCQQARNNEQSGGSRWS